MAAGTLWHRADWCYGPATVKKMKMLKELMHGGPLSWKAYLGALTDMICSEWTSMVGLSIYQFLGGCCWCLEHKVLLFVKIFLLSVCVYLHELSAKSSKTWSHFYINTALLRNKTVSVVCMPVLLGLGLHLLQLSHGRFLMLQSKCKPWPCIYSAIWSIAVAVSSSWYLPPHVILSQLQVWKLFVKDRSLSAGCACGCCPHSVNLVTAIGVLL